MPTEVLKLSEDDAKHLAINFKVEATHKPGATRLDEFPLLVYAPIQHGDGIRIEDNGTPVAEIARQAAELPGYEALAKHFHTSPEHIRQAIAYAVQASKPGV